MRNSLFKRKIDIFVLSAVAILFLGMMFFSPVKEYGDSYQYMHHMLSRDPAYSLLLQVLQALFTDYKYPLGIIQNILAIVCIYWTYVRLSELFEFNTFGRLMTILLLLAPHLITPLASVTRIVMTCSVLTEGISLSLYYVWLGIMISIIAGHYRNRTKGVFFGLFLSVFLSFIRGQFVICIAIWLLASLYDAFSDRDRKRVFICMISFIIALAGKKYLTGVYHYLENGINTGTAASAPMLLTNMIYVMDEADIAKIQAGWIKDAVEDMYQSAKEQGLTYEYAGDTILDKAAFHEEVHETLNFEIVTVVIDELLHKYEGINEGNYSVFLYYRDVYANSIIKKLMPIVFLAYVRNVAITSVLGFVRSVAIDKGIFVIYALLVYILSFILTVLLLRKDRSDLAATSMVLVWILIAGTVFGVSLMIECISRYMMYNLPIFYIVGLAELKRYGCIGYLRNI